MAIGEQGKPYIHSKLSNFRHQARYSYLNKANDEWQARFKRITDNLTVIRNQLQEATTDFLGRKLESINGRDELNVRDLMMQNNNDYYQWTKEFFLSPEVEKIFEEIVIDADRLNKLKEDEILKELVGKGQIKLEGTQQLNQVVGTILQQVQDAISYGKVVLSGEHTDLNKLLAGMIKATEKEIPEGYLEELYKYHFRNAGSSSKLGKIIKKYITKRLGLLNDRRAELKKAVQAYFERRMLEAENNGVRVEEPTAYVEDLCTIIDTFDFWGGEYSEAKGPLGEDMLSFIENHKNITNANRPRIEWTVTATLNENQIVEKFKKFGISKMKTHHADDKFSQTDMVLKNNKDQVARVQSKNLVSAYQSVVSQTQTAFPGIARLNQPMKYKALISQLGGAKVLTLTDDDLRDLEYLLANEVWFRVKGSFNPTGGKKKSGKTTYATASRLQSYGHKIATEIFTKELCNFMGITVEYTTKIIGEKEIKEAVSRVDIGGSNLFYAVSTVVLIPTYRIIEDILNFIENSKETMIKVQLTLNTKSIHLEKNAARDLWYRKFPKDGSRVPNPNGVYEDDKLVAIGGDMGERILEQLELRNIGLNFDLEKLLTTSYVF